MAEGAQHADTQQARGDAADNSAETKTPTPRQFTLNNGVAYVATPDNTSCPGKKDRERGGKYLDWYNGYWGQRIQNRYKNWRW